VRSLHSSSASAWHHLTGVLVIKTPVVVGEATVIMIAVLALVLTLQLVDVGL